MTRALRLRSLSSALAASALLAGCGAGAKSATTSTHGHTKPLTLEEMTEYDANEGRCHDDHGSVRNVGTVDAYCAFPNRSDDFHLLESAKKTQINEEE